MHFDQIGLKDVLDWLMPLLIGWIGSSLVKYLKAGLEELKCAKDSVVALNKKMGDIIDILQNHESRISHVETKVKR
jgi:hypothetical protein